MTVDAVEFASLLCSRLCHDLLSPVGALNNGIELLSDETDPQMRQQCLDLLSDSARTTANKLKFFRLAFGAAGGYGEQVDAREAQTAIEGLFSTNKRIELGWMVAEPTLSKAAIKVLLNLAMIAGDTLVRGGRLDVGAEVHLGRTEIAVRATGDRLILDDTIRATLSGQTAPADLAPRVAAAWMAHSIAMQAGGSVLVSEPGQPFLLFGATLGV